MGTRGRVDTSPVAQGCPRGLKLRVQYESHTFRDQADDNGGPADIPPGIVGILGQRTDAIETQVAVNGDRRSCHHCSNRELVRVIKRLY